MCGVGVMFWSIWLCVPGPLKWKENLGQKAAEAFYKRQQSTPNLRRLVYGNGKLAASLIGEVKTVLFCDWSPQFGADISIAVLCNLEHIS